MWAHPDLITRVGQFAEALVLGAAQNDTAVAIRVRVRVGTRKETGGMRGDVMRADMLVSGVAGQQPGVQPG